MGQPGVGLGAGAGAGAATATAGDGDNVPPTFHLPPRRLSHSNRVGPGDHSRRSSGASANSAHNQSMYSARPAQLVFFK